MAAQSAGEGIRTPKAITRQQIPNLLRFPSFATPARAELSERDQRWRLTPFPFIEQPTVVCK